MMEKVLARIRAIVVAVVPALLLLAPGCNGGDEMEEDTRAVTDAYCGVFLNYGSFDELVGSQTPAAGPVTRVLAQQGSIAEALPMLDSAAKFAPKAIAPDAEQLAEAWKEWSRDHGEEAALTPATEDDSVRTSLVAVDLFVRVVCRAAGAPPIDE